MPAIQAPEEVGTLIAVIIKAKNLPNRRRLGKQDPYCTLRLGQNAQSTKVDKRGGQTPYWNHEFRFTVTESDDQFKLTVLDDNDSKPELIGDCMIELKPALLTTSKEGYDKWHSLMYRQKYAGEVFIEMTFYRSKRFSKSLASPSPTKSIPQSPTHQSPKSSPSKRTPSKRRPLPASPAGGTPLENGVAGAVSSSQSLTPPMHRTRYVVQGTPPQVQLPMIRSNSQHPLKSPSRGATDGESYYHYDYTVLPEMSPIHSSPHTGEEEERSSSMRPRRPLPNTPGPEQPSQDQNTLSHSPISIERKQQYQQCQQSSPPKYEAKHDQTYDCEYDSSGYIYYTPDDIDPELSAEVDILENKLRSMG
ncbi:C2 domain-containing protein [Dipodascopsis uninucleata]